MDKTKVNVTIPTDFNYKIDEFQFNSDGSLQFGPFIFLAQNFGPHHARSHHLTYENRRVKCVSWLLHNFHWYLRLHFEDNMNLIGSLPRGTISGLLSLCVGSHLSYMDNDLFDYLSKNNKHLPYANFSCLCNCSENKCSNDHVEEKNEEKDQKREKDQEKESSSPLSPLKQDQPKGWACIVKHPTEKDPIEQTTKVGESAVVENSSQVEKATQKEKATETEESPGFRQYLFDELQRCIGETNNMMADGQFCKAKQLVELLKMAEK
jgi:hypothetical protein